MISKHLLISIFLVTSLFAGSKTKRDKGKSDSTPTSGDAKDIVREEKLGREEEEEAEDDQVSDHSKEVRPDQEEAEEGEPKEPVYEAELHEEGDEVAEELKRETERSD